MTATTFKYLAAGLTGLGLAFGGWALAGKFDRPAPPPPAHPLAEEGAPRVVQPVAAQALALTHTFVTTNPVTAVAFGPGVVAAGDQDGALVLWDTQTGREKETVLEAGTRRAKSIDRVQFSPDGAWLYLVTDNAQSEHQCTVEKTDRVFQSAGGRGNWVSYGATADGEYWLERVTGSTELLLQKNAVRQAGTGGFATAQFLHDQAIDHAAAGGADAVVTVSGGVLRRWAIGVRTPVWESKLEQIAPTLVAVAADGKSVAVAGRKGEVHLFSGATGKLAGKLAGHDGAVRAAAFSPDGKRVVTGGDDKTARVWDVETGKEVTVLKDHAAAVTAVSFSPDGDQVATGSADRTVKVWGLKPLKAVAKAVAD